MTMTGNKYRFDGTGYSPLSLGLLFCGPDTLLHGFNMGTRALILQLSTCPEGRFKSITRHVTRLSCCFDFSFGIWDVLLL